MEPGERDIPDEDRVQCCDLPIGLGQQRDVELQPLIPPQFTTPNLARVCHVAQNRQREFLERAFGAVDTLQDRNDIVERRVFLARLVEAAQVVDGAEDLVGNLAEVRLLHAGAQQLRQHVDGVAVLQRVKRGAEHRQVLDELEHGDLMRRRHALELFEDAWGYHCQHGVKLLGAEKDLRCSTVRSATSSLT